MADAETRVSIAQQERTRLEGEIDALANALRQVQERNTALNAELASIERRLEETSATRSAVQSYVLSLERHLDDIDVGISRALAYRPPRELLARGCAEFDRFERGRIELERSRAESAAVRADITDIWTQFVTGQITSSVVVELLKGLLARLGWRFLNPWVGFAALLWDLRELYVAIERSERAVNRERNEIASPCPLE